MRLLGPWKAGLVTVLIGMECSRSLLAGGILPRRVAPKSCLERVAEELDRLERQLHDDGTVVVKAPDVWGESRLTKHRQEFERVLEAEVGRFELLLNASIRRSDQAYLASALAIQAALGGPSTDDVVATDLNFVSQLVNEQAVSAAPEPAKTEGAATPPATVPIQRTNVFQSAPGVPATQFSGFANTAATTIGVGLEPTIRLDQLKRYLDHLHEIRRINEGDDTADSPGYSLNLVRIPVSILPGERTREGHGAEVTITAVPHVSPELLPKVFRELVINDLVDSLGMSLIKVAEQIDQIAYETDERLEPTGKWTDVWQQLNEQQRLELVVLGTLPVQTVSSGAAADGAAPAGGSPLDIQTFNNYLQRKGVPLAMPASPTRMGPTSAQRYQLPELQRRFSEAAVSGSVGTSGVIGRIRNGRQPVAPTQLAKVFGEQEILTLGYEFWRTHSNRPLERQVPEARAYLKEQLEAAFDFLHTEENLCLWAIVPEVHSAVRGDRIDMLDNIRALQVRKPYQLPDPTQSVDVPSPISSCAWWVLVESALLNQQLNDDMRRVSQDPQCACMIGDCWHQFYEPIPSPEARQAFVDYVKCRWPVHVFALDPVAQQQNIADQFSMRREMQLALALSFAAGRTRAQSMTRLARRLELDMETIALNRTQVAFGHGSDTFGWRFTPRVQTPPFESNATVFLRDSLWGGPSRDALRRRWELEAGQHECVAVVLMPSFIEHMTFQARGNYFKLTDCHGELCRKDDLRSSLARDVRWSEQMQTLDTLLNEVHCEASRFLPGEVDRVQSRVQQLSRRLPLQTVHARVPNENTLGGFEMFSSGVTDLAPELLSYYGAPGIDPQGDTELFLVGKHFSVHETKVLAGNRNCDFRLISREVMQVTVPSGVQVCDEIVPGTVIRRPVVHVNLATPYGVTTELSVPVIDGVRCPPSVFAFTRTEVPMAVQCKVAVANNTRTYELPATSIRVRKPHAIGIQNPQSVTPINGAVLKCTATTNSDLVSSTVLTLPDLNLIYSIPENQYVVQGPEFTKLLQAAVAQLQLYLNANYGKTEQPAAIEIRMSGVVGTTALSVGAVQGEVHLIIKLEEEK